MIAPPLRVEDVLGELCQHGLYSSRCRECGAEPLNAEVQAYALGDVSIRHDEAAAYMDWKTAAAELRIAQDAYNAAQVRFRAALQRLSEIVAPVRP